MYVVFFFFKQKTAYEIRLSLVGSEMCIRDSLTTRVSNPPKTTDTMKRLFSVAMLLTLLALPLTCLAQAQRSQEFKDKYKLKEAVVLSHP